MLTRHFQRRIEPMTMQSDPQMSLRGGKGDGGVSPQHQCLAEIFGLTIIIRLSAAVSAQDCAVLNASIAVVKHAYIGRFTDQIDLD